jgi:hypothetical protein
MAGHQPNQLCHNYPMPSSKILTTKQWGKVDKAALHKFVVSGNVDIKDTSMENFDSVQDRYFPHSTQCNFQCSFKDLSAVFDLELGLARARQEPIRGKMHVLFFLLIVSYQASI